LRKLKREGDFKEVNLNGIVTFSYLFLIRIENIRKIQQKFKSFTSFMLILSILFLLLSNAVTLRRDKSILYSRVAIIVLLYSSFIAITTLFITCLDTGIGLYGGLFHATSTTQIFHVFIFLISAVILQLTAFYPRKV